MAHNEACASQSLPQHPVRDDREHASGQSIGNADLRGAAADDRLRNPGQGDPGEPGGEASRKLTKLSKEKDRVSHLGQNNTVWTGMFLSTGTAGRRWGGWEVLV